MNCFTGTSMMISEQSKAVCCRRECVEQNWILFSSEVLTALRIRQVLGTFEQQQKAYISFIISVCRTVCSQISVRFSPDRCMWNLFGVFMKICQENPNLIECDIKEPFTPRSNYVSLWLATLIRHKRVIYEWNCIRLLGWPWRHKNYANASHFYNIRTLSVCLSVCIWRGTEIFICTYWCSQNQLQYTAVVCSKGDCKLKLLLTVQDGQFRISDTMSYSVTSIWY